MINLVKRIFYFHVTNLRLLVHSLEAHLSTQKPLNLALIFGPLQFSAAVSELLSS